MDSVVVIGGAGHAKVVISILKKLEKYDIAGYIDKVDRGSILGAQYLGDDDILNRLIEEDGVKNAVIGIGHLKDNALRHELSEKLSKMGFSFPPIVSPGSIVNEDVIIGAGTVVMDGVVINSGTRIGECCILNTSSSIDHDCQIGNFVHVCPGATLSGGVKIGNDSFIGTGATIIHYKTVGPDCLIGAGAVVVDDCLEETIYLGVPARPAH